MEITNKQNDKRDKHVSHSTEMKTGTAYVPF
jgi:hypothetical protein